MPHRVGNRRAHHKVVVLPGERLRPVILVVAERQHFFEQLPVGEPLRMRGEHLHQIRNRPRAALPVGAEAVALPHLPRVGVLPLAAVLIRILHLLQLHHRVGGEVRLYGDKRIVVEPPECINLPDVFRLAVFLPELGSDPPRHVVDDDCREVVRSLARRVAAEHIRNAILRQLVERDRAGLALRPLAVCKLSAPGGLGQPFQPENDLLVVEYARAAVEKRLAGRGGILLPEHVQAPAAVVRNAPPPPLELLVRQLIGGLEIPLLRRPFRPRHDRHRVVRVFKPREEHRLKVVLPRNGGVPALLEVLKAVRRALDDDHRSRQTRHGL